MISIYHSRYMASRLLFVWLIFLSCLSYSQSEVGDSSRAVACSVSDHAHARGLFVDLINRLRSDYPNGSLVGLDLDVNSIPEFQALKPYLTDSNPGIYGFYYRVGRRLSFSFSKTHTGADVNLFILEDSPLYTSMDFVAYGAPSAPVIPLSFQGPEVYTPVGFDGKPSLESMVRHIDFCKSVPVGPCGFHIALVVDESSSIDELEASKIKKQLRYFINQQVAVNTSEGSQMRVSLIGMSLSDVNARQDHVIGNQALSSSNESVYLNWIDSYKNRLTTSTDNSRLPGDYWLGALERAQAVSADMVIMIADGGQTSNLSNLKQVMRGFKNHRENLDLSAPNLFVIGISEGYYPGEGPSGHDVTVDGSEGQVNLNLGTSLKYLLGMVGSYQTEFPLELEYTEPSKIDYMDFSSSDYVSIDKNFKLLSKDKHFLSNGISKSGVGCGPMVLEKFCSSCYGFQPVPKDALVSAVDKHVYDGKYVLSGWVMEEHKSQVKTYKNAKIRLIFRDVSQQLIGTPLDFIASGFIIDRWQRIFSPFTIPSEAVFMEIELVNENSEAIALGEEATKGVVAAYFDDIRIHPLDGSMKSFVYDPETFRLMAEQDENNYSTFYQYDKEGGLIRVKKETSRGVMTIQETRSSSVIKSVE